MNEHQINGEKLKKIKRRIEIGGDHINLCRLGLTDRELKVVLAMILEQNPHLKSLDLGWNKLTSIPKMIGEFKAMEKLDLSHNELDKLPFELEGLARLTRLNLEHNQLGSHPFETEIILNLHQLKYLTVYSNQFNRKSRKMINEYLKNQWSKDPYLSKEAFTPLNFGPFLSSSANIVLNSLIENSPYGEEEIRKLNSVLKTLHDRDYTSFARIGNESFSGLEVLEDFLTHIFSMIHRDQEDYVSIHPVIAPVLFDYMDILKSGNGDAIKMALAEMATALGNCSTPVRSLLFTKAGCRALDKSHRNVDPKMYIHLEREALRIEVVKQLKPHKTEPIELVAGLLNSLYGEKISEALINKVRIARDPKRACLSGASQHADFATNLITPSAAMEFAKLCCKKDDNGELITDANGFYVLDNNKLSEITNSYLGIQQSTTAIFRTKFQELIAHPKNTELLNSAIEEGGAFEKEALQLFDEDHWVTIMNEDHPKGFTGVQKDVVEHYLDRVATEIKNLHKRFKAPKPSQGTAPTDTPGGTGSKTLPKQAYMPPSRDALPDSARSSRPPQNTPSPSQRRRARR